MMWHILISHHLFFLISKYKIKIYYSGINFSAPEKVYYSTYLDNFDLDWSKMTTIKGSII